jgi:3-(3-hydroxy-phenyl)propionate hydroxylase/flavoprotein hydroxylase
MRLPHESKEELNTEAAAWRLLEPWGLTAASATLVRHAVYTFNGRWADRWRQARLILAGDSAHLMPPFLGQGLGSGVRDAMALAWRLQHVMTGRAPDTLLDSYGPERIGNVRQIIEEAVQLGRIICVQDPVAAAERDRQMLAALADPSLAPPPPPPWRLGPSDLLRRDDPNAGLLSVQGVVRQGDRIGLFDDVVGRGFMLVSSSADPCDSLGPEALAFWRGVHGRSAHVSPQGPVVDVDGAYARWFEQLGADLVLVRPDFYIFGAAADVTEAEALVRSLAGAMRVSVADASTDTRLSTASA